MPFDSPSGQIDWTTLIRTLDVRISNGGGRFFLHNQCTQWFPLSGNSDLGHQYMISNGRFGAFTLDPSEASGLHYSLSTHLEAMRSLQKQRKNDLVTSRENLGESINNRMNIEY